MRSLRAQKSLVVPVEPRALSKHSSIARLPLWPARSAIDPDRIQIMLYRSPSSLDEALDSCIESLQRGEDITPFLQAHPELADELAPLLYVATKLPDLPKPELSMQARRR